MGWVKKMAKCPECGKTIDSVIMMQDCSGTWTEEVTLDENGDTIDSTTVDSDIDSSDITGVLCPICRQSIHIVNPEVDLYNKIWEFFHPEKTVWDD